MTHLPPPPELGQEEARDVLRSCQPLPFEAERDRVLERRYVRALQRLAAEPTGDDLALALGSFNGDLSDSLFEACGDVLEAAPAASRRAALEAAMRQGPPEARAWAAGWLDEFPDPALLVAVEELLGRLSDPMLLASVVSGLAGLAREASLPRARELLRELAGQTQDPHLKITIAAHLREL